MRTTLTLDPDVALKLKARVTRQGVTFKQAVNDAIRRGLESEGPPARFRFKVKARPLGLRPGIDYDKLGQMADQLEAEEFARNR